MFPQPPPRLKALPQEEADKTWFWRGVSRLARQKWLTVGALLVVGVGGIVAADSVAELVVGKLQIDEDEEF